MIEFLRNNAAIIAKDKMQFALDCVKERNKLLAECGIQMEETFYYQRILLAEQVAVLKAKVLNELFRLDLNFDE